MSDEYLPGYGTVLAPGMGGPQQAQGQGQQMSPEQLMKMQMLIKLLNDPGNTGGLAEGGRLNSQSQNVQDQLDKAMQSRSRPDTNSGHSTGQGAALGAIGSIGNQIGDQRQDDALRLRQDEGVKSQEIFRQKQIDAQREFQAKRDEQIIKALRDFGGGQDGPAPAQQQSSMLRDYGW